MGHDKAGHKKTGHIRTSKSEAFAAGIALAVLIAASLACVSGETTSGDSTGAIDASISGTVTAGGAPVSGARVSVDRGDFYATTDASGRYSLSVYGGRTYNVFASYNGYKTVVTQGVRPASGGSITTNLALATLLGVGERTYVGSTYCKLCHATQYNQWKNAAHRHGMTSPGDSPGIIAAADALFSSGLNLSTTTAFTAYGANAPVLSRSGDTRIVTIGNVAYPVHYVLGFTNGQAFLTRIGNALYPLPLQYNRASADWITYQPDDWYNGTTPRYTAQASIESDVYKRNSWERQCMGCHAVTGILQLTWGAGGSGIQQHLSDYVEKGVGCEACHGPASAHVWANGALGSASNPNVVNPRNYASRNRQLDLCGSCHSAGVGRGTIRGLAGDTFTPLYYYDSAAARTFRMGDTLLANLYESGVFWGGDTIGADTFAEARVSKGNHQQWNDLWQSGHLAPGAADTTITCGSCHNSHGPVSGSGQTSISADSNALCLTCHGLGGRANQEFVNDAAVIGHTNVEHHTYAPGSTGAGRCVNCHMPKTAQAGVRWDIRSHTFRILRPHNTYRSYRASMADTMPNTCQQSCHNAGSSLGNDFGSGMAGALTALYNYDSYVEQPAPDTYGTPVARLSGTISLPGAANLPGDSTGTWVTIINEDIGCVTNESGQYSVLLGVPGTYWINVNRTGYVARTDTIVLTNGTLAQTWDTSLVAFGAAAVGDSKPARCGSCHGGIWGAEWRRSGFEGVQRVEHEEEGSIEMAEGHGLIQASPARNATCRRCHEGKSARLYLQAGGDSRSVGTTLIGQFNNTVDSVSARPQTCQACHTGHADSATVAPYQLNAYRTTNLDTGFLYSSKNAVSYGSPAFPAPYEATACILCHNNRTPPSDSGVGVRFTGGNYTTNSSATPHDGPQSEAYFGGIGVNPTIYGASVNFDSAVYPDSPTNSLHPDSWGTQYSYQTFQYANGAPLLVYRSDGTPDAHQNERFTCISCHMWNQKPGTYGGGTQSAHDGGHTWKPDVQSCAVCHDPAYVTLNPYANVIEASAGAGDVGIWGTDSWGVSSTGRFLGLERPASASRRPGYANGNDSGSTFADTDGSRDHGDGVVNDWDGDGRSETTTEEVRGLYYRVFSAFGDTYSGIASGIDTTPGFGGTANANFNHTRTSQSGTTFYYSRSRPSGNSVAAVTDITRDEARAAYNIVFVYHQDPHGHFSGHGKHNVRFMVDLLRKTWRALGRNMMVGANVARAATWHPPGDDY